MGLFDCLLEILIWASFLSMVYFLFRSDGALGQEYESVRLNWDAVTTRENGDLLEPGELQFYRVRQIDSEGHEVGAYETTPDVRHQDIQVLAGECYRFHAYSAATPGPACHPELTYTMSQPSGGVTNCKSDMTPNPPKDFGV